MVRLAERDWRSGDQLSAHSDPASSLHPASPEAPSSTRPHERKSTFKPNVRDACRRLAPAPGPDVARVDVAAKYPARTDVHGESVKLIAPA